MICFFMRKNPLRCPKCNTILPIFRIPTHLYQLMWGGWTCPKCETELDKKGEARK